jgi:hypothetical protein
MRRFMQALDCGEEVVDPFTLLRDLDNGLVWWLCKTYAISGFNLQVNQTQSPDYFAFLEAMEALYDGLCARVLVGGLRTGPREAVAGICRRREEPATPDTAIFFILELAEGPPARALARLELVAANEGIGCGEGTLDFSLALVAALTRLDQGCVRLSAHDRPWSIDIRRTS